MTAREGHPAGWFPAVDVTANGWTPLARDALRVLWAEGHPVIRIGVALRCGKNAVVGQAHRLNLPARPSPIGVAGPRNANAGGGGRPRALLKRVAPGALPPVPGRAVQIHGPAPMAAAGLLPGGHAGEVASGGAASPVPPPARPVVAAREPAPGVPRKPVTVHRRCQMPRWPDKARRDHADYGRFCEAPTVGGTSWCATCLPRVAAQVRLREVA